LRLEPATARGHIVGVRRKISVLFLLVAWLCANGVVWNAVQVVGWVKMVRDYSEVMPFTQALSVTFSGEAPCDFCRVAESGREQAEQLPQQATLGAAMEKIFFVADTAPVVVLPVPTAAWPVLAAETGSRRIEAVPVPPPRV
jgi:hypothetical protein